MMAGCQQWQTQKKKQIPFGDDNQKGNRNNQKGNSNSQTANSDAEWDLCGGFEGHGVGDGRGGLLVAEAALYDGPEEGEGWGLVRLEGDQPQTDDGEMFFDGQGDDVGAGLGHRRGAEEEARAGGEVGELGGVGVRGFDDAWNDSMGREDAVEEGLSDGAVFEAGGEEVVVAELVDRDGVEAGEGGLARHEEDDGLVAEEVEADAGDAGVADHEDGVDAFFLEGCVLLFAVELGELEVEVGVVEGELAEDAGECLLAEFGAA